MDELRQVLEKTPDLVRDLGGELPYEIERDIAVAIAGDDVVQQAAILAAMSIRRTTLVEDTTPPIEQALVEDVILCWLRYQHAVIELTRSQAESRSHRKFLQSHADGAQRRYLAAIRLLITANTRLNRKMVRFDAT